MISIKRCEILAPDASSHLLRLILVLLRDYSRVMNVTVGTWLTYGSAYRRT
jgi:hypothetical protein